jgi:ATP-dependent DNA helicase RecQ
LQILSSRLQSLNIPAALLNSSLEAPDRRRVQEGIARSEYRLIFVAPERFAAGGLGAFAIDEAHWVSHWGHEFREDYRSLGRLKESPRALLSSR